MGGGAEGVDDHLDRHGKGFELGEDNEGMGFSKTREMSGDGAVGFHGAWLCLIPCLFLGLSKGGWW